MLFGVCHLSNEHQILNLIIRQLQQVLQEYQNGLAVCLQTVILADVWLFVDCLLLVLHACSYSSVGKTLAQLLQSVWIG